MKAKHARAAATTLAPAHKNASNLNVLAWKSAWQPRLRRVGHAPLGEKPIKIDKKQQISTLTRRVLEIP
jgi:hypothetical protein